MPTDWITLKAAANQLHLKDRAIRYLVTAGKIRKQDGLLNAADVARELSEKQKDKQRAKIRALATMEPDVRHALELVKARNTLTAAGHQVQPGNPAIAAVPPPAPKPFLNLASAAEYLDVSERLVLRFKRQGLLHPEEEPPVEGQPRVLRFTRRELDALPERLERRQEEQGREEQGNRKERSRTAGAR